MLKNIGQLALVFIPAALVLGLFLGPIGILIPAAAMAVGFLFDEAR